MQRSAVEYNRKPMIGRCTEKHMRFRTCSARIRNGCSKFRTGASKEVALHTFFFFALSDAVGISLVSQFVRVFSS